MDELALFEILLWIVIFILLFLVVRGVLKAFFPNRAVFRSKNDDERKKREVEEEGMEEEDEEMMKSEKKSVNGQRYTYFLTPFLTPGA